MEQRKQRYLQNLQKQIDVNRVFGDRNREAQQQRQYDITPVAPAERTLEEESFDTVLQQKQALTNARKVVRADVANEFVSSLDTEALLRFNQVFPVFRKEVQKYQNVTSFVLRELLDRYLTFFDQNMGITDDQGDGADSTRARLEQALNFLPEDRVETFLKSSLTEDQLGNLNVAEFVAFVTPYTQAMVTERVNLRGLYTSFRRGTANRAQTNVRVNQRTNELRTGAATAKQALALERELQTLHRNIQAIEARLAKVTQQHQMALDSIDQKRQTVNTRAAIEKLDVREAQLQQSHEARVQRMQQQRAAYVAKAASVATRLQPLIGGGLGVIDSAHEERFAPFGRYIIHLPSLNDSVLNIKFKSMASHHKMPRKVISSKLRDVLLETIQRGHVPVKEAQKLTTEDKALLHKTLTLSKVESPLVIEEDEAEMDRFLLLRGIINAGNDNPDIVKELKGLLMKFMQDGRLKKTDINKVMYELAMFT